MQEVSTLRKRMAPSTPLILELIDDNGDKFSRSFKLCFDFAAGVAIQKETGLNLRDFRILAETASPTALSVLFWAAVLRHHPEYDSEEGLEVIRSYMDEANSEAIEAALWQAYLNYQTKPKREFLIKMKERAEAEANLEASRGEAASPLAQAESTTSPSLGTISAPSAASTSDSPTTSSAA